jgi:filamentous hemagglutinin
MAASLLCGSVSVAATLPVPCAVGSCAPAGKNPTPGFTAPTGFVTSGQATATQSGNTLTVNQTSSQAILNWASFNISSDGKVVFQQPTTTSIALNKIFQQSPSSIFGQLTANGQIYLINPNGIVFGATASVNTAALVASSLGLTSGDSELSSGIAAQPVTAGGKPQSSFASDGRIYVLDSSGNPVLDAQGNPQTVQIMVQPGAQLTAADGGRVMLLGQSVTNGGTITAPDGQIVLAAGQSVYLQASTDPSMRGLIVQVSGGTPATTTNGVTTPATGTTNNQTTGVLTAERGNVSLLGLAVNQSGRISASTAVSANGSVYLEAGGYDPTGSCTVSTAACLNQGGTLTVGPTSEINLLPDSSQGGTATVGQAQIQSQIKALGQEVDIEGGSITAPGGNLQVLAAVNPDVGVLTVGNTAAQIQVGAGTNINLAGSDAVVPMSDNLVSIQLRSNELADDPDQHNGALEAQTVIVDLRDGRPPIISDTSWQSVLAGVTENILQRTAVGGTASFQSEGSIVVNNGSTINVSGGAWNYQPGVTQTSMLIGTNGQAYNISTADPTLSYTGVMNPTFTTSYNGFGVQITQATPGLGYTESGYTEGFSAGKVSFAAPAMALQGSLVGTAVNGSYQRSVAQIPTESLMGYLVSNSLIPGDGIATGGTLTIGTASGPSTANSLPEFLAPAITFTNSVSPVIVAVGTPLPPQTMELSPSYITSGGFSQTNIYADGTVTLPAGLPLNLGAGGSLVVEAPRIVVDSNIQALSGTIDLQAVQTTNFTGTGLPRLGITIGNGVTLDVRGQWTNDSPDAPATAVAPAYQDGGVIDLSLGSAASSASNPFSSTGGQLVLGNNVSLEASGGAWVQANNKVTGGTGGSITLGAAPYQSALQIGSNVSLDAFGVEGAAGGSFSLAAPRMLVDAGSGSWATAQQVDDLLKPGGAFEIGAPLFSQYGFSNVTLTATAPILPPASSGTGTGGTAASSVLPNDDVLTVAAGTSIDAQAQSLELNPGYLTRASGGDVLGFTTRQLLPANQQSATSVSLQVTSAASSPDGVTSGDLDLQAGASIETTANSNSQINLIGEGSIFIRGTLRALGGTITALITDPDTHTDPGFLPDQTLELGSQGVLDVSGTAVLTPNSLNMPLGTVLAGGTVNLVTDRGDIVAEAGSLINIQGGSATLDVQNLGGAGGYQRGTVGSAGGLLNIESLSSVSLLGNVLAAGGASSTGKMQGGTLELTLDPTSFSFATGVTPANPVPQTPGTIEIVSSTAGSTPTASYGNLALLGVAQLETWGIDDIQLNSDNTIELASDTALTMGREILLNAPRISVSYGTSAALNAPFVEISDTQSTPPPSVPLPGTGSLSVTAQQIVLAGNITLQGAANTTLTSAGDVEFEPWGTGVGSGGAAAPVLSGTLSLSGNLTIDAARIYPATQTSFTIADTGSNGTVTIGQTNASPGTPLSAAGSFTIDAANIVSSGTILAPFGTITLAATNSLSLLNGSVTSVSADGATIPYGQTVLSGAQWVYDTTIPVNGVPNREVSLTAPNVSFASGATIDVSGGGNLSAYEWVPGTNGFSEALSQQNAAASGLFAILPSTRGQFASYDLQEFTGSNVGPGGAQYLNSVYLSGVPGLPAGYYPLLPARDALLSGALLIQMEPGYQSLTPGSLGKLADGTPVVAGYLTFGNTGLQSSSLYTGFAIRSSSYLNNLDTYTVSTASSYFANAAATSGATNVALPADAGTLLIAAGSSLNALGRVNSAAGAGGTAATIELSANDLTVTASNATNTGTSGVTIGASVLSSWNAGDLILGGQLASDGSGLIVTADNVTIGAGAQFNAGQVVAVANNTIEVQAGANVASTSGAGGPAPATLPSQSSLSLLQSDSKPGSPDPDYTAALLAVSDSSLPIVARGSLAPYTPGTGSGSAGSSGSGTSTPSIGTIQIDSGATLSTRGAVALDAPGGISVLGTINAPGASWSLASSSIAFVGAGGSSSDTLVINPALLAQMQSAGALQLTAIGSIDLLTSVNLGASSASSTPAFSTLGLTAAAINNTAGGNSVFGGQTLLLQGSANGTPAAPTAGTGTLTFVAKTVDMGTAPVSDSSSSSASTGSTTPPPATALVVNGNSQTNFQASGAFVGQGTSTLGISGNTTIAATELTSASQSDVSINVPDGTINIMQSGVADKPSALTASLGGQISLSASAIQDSGSIIVPGGRISLVAAPDPNAPNNGGSTAPPSNITLSSSAVIDAGGITVSAGNQTVGAAGGIVNISATGDLTLPAGSNINVSGAGDAPAGFLSLTAGGTATLGGALAGNAAAGATGGNFWLDAGQLVGGLPALAGTLTTGGFTNSIDIRVRNGDLDSAAGTTLTANQIVLTADNGVIDIAGTLDAPSAGLRGSIGLFAGNGLTLESTAQLIANSTGTGDNSAALGGEIELSTVNNYITLNSGSLISASGATAEQGGMLLLRAPAVMSDGDVQISNVNSTVTGLAQVIIEPVLPTVVSSGDLGQDMSQIESSVSSYLAANQASGIIAQRFPKSSSTTTVVLEPGVVVTSTGSISNNESIDLYALQTGGQLGAPIDLTVRAAGSIDLGQSISDGISGTTLSATASSSLRFVAGADLSSANPLATVAGSNQSLTLESGTQIRTGTGDIDLVASGDINIDPNASAYTLGKANAATPSVSVRLGTPTQIVFPTGGGNVVVNAGGSVLGSDLSDPGSPSDWQARSSASTADGQLGFYGINVTAYAQNPFSFATLGSGDVSITAAQDVVDVSAAAADTLSLSGTTQTHLASGGMTVVAGRDITTGQFFVADGIGTFNAGRSIATTSGLTTDAVGSIFELGDAQISAWAEGDITVNAVMNPTLLPQPKVSTGAVSNAFYVTYSADSAFNAQSSSGNVTLNTSGADATLLLGSTQADTPATDFYPGSLRLASLTQDILLPAGTSITLSPSVSGQLSLFAGQDIVQTEFGSGIYMSDAPADLLPTVTAAPTLSGPNAVVAFVNAESGSGETPYDFNGDLHQSDSTPASIVAGRDINGLLLSIPKAADIIAGRDIVSLVYTGQNLNPNDVTLISAGRDFIDPTAITKAGLADTSSATVNVGGVGQLDVLAGRNINLGLSEGVTTSGNLLNGNLPGGSGASITMLAGLGQQPHDSGFLSTIIETSATYQQELVQYVESVTGQSGLSTGQADTQFSSLNQSAQQAFVDNVFFNELNLSGIESQQRGGNYSRGYAAIDALFPGSRAAAANGTTPPYAGDLDLTYSQIYALAGGNITLLVPGGGMEVGLASAPQGAAAKAPSQLGIVTEGSGNVNIYAQNDVNVNSSRVFTLGGGNLLIWSNLGSIDAGNGAKTSLSLPPPTFITDKFGNETLEYGAAVVGSGIRTIQTGPGQPAGNVNLIAPVGSVNAGDAGIGAAGNINIAAVTVTGASNINFGGTATGVPAAVGNIAASVSGAATSGTAATNAAAEIAASAANTQAAPVTQAAISWLDVFVTGLGDENCKPEDEECLKRQKSRE